jgi:hypothetical protein
MGRGKLSFPKKKTNIASANCQNNNNNNNKRIEVYFQI